MCSVTTVVMLCDLVHMNPTVLGSQFILERSRRRSAAAGAFSLSTVIVVFTTVLLKSEISKLLHPNCFENQNNNLLKVVLGDGRKRVDEELPILNIRLDKCWPVHDIFIADQSQKHGSVASQTPKCVVPDCAFCLLGIYPLKRVVL